MFLNCRGCLRSWLEQDTVCPTCRRSLSQDLRQEGVAGGQGQGAETTEGGRGQGRRRNWLLHFNGASIASWLPTFSLELHQEDALINDAAALHRGVNYLQLLTSSFGPGDKATTIMCMYHSIPGKRPWALYHNSQSFSVLGAYPGYWALTMCKN